MCEWKVKTDNQESTSALQELVDFVQHLWYKVTRKHEANCKWRKEAMG